MRQGHPTPSSVQNRQPFGTPGAKTYNTHTEKNKRKTFHSAECVEVEKRLAVRVVLAVRGRPGFVVDVSGHAKLLRPQLWDYWDQLWPCQDLSGIIGTFGSPTFMI